MKTVSSMIEALDNNKVSFLKFTRKYSKNKDTPICFFEGNPAGYRPEVIQERINSGTCHSIECKSKKNANEIYHIIKRNKKYCDTQIEIFDGPDYRLIISESTELKIEKIMMKYPYQWVAIEESDWDEYGEPTKGYVITHNTKHEALIDNVRKFHYQKPKSKIYTFYSNPYEYSLL